MVVVGGALASATCSSAAVFSSCSWCCRFQTWTYEAFLPAWEMGEGFQQKKARVAKEKGSSFDLLLWGL